jgi:hypothetical protein
MSLTRQLRKRALPANGSGGPPPRRTRVKQPLDTSLAVAPQTRNLCGRCESLDIDALFARPPLSRRWELIEDLGHVSTWDDDCPFCKLLVEIARGSKGSKHSSYSLKVSACSRELGWGWQTLNKAILKVHPHDADELRELTTPFLISQREDEYAARIIPPLVDFDVVKPWLDICESQHAKTCGVGGHLTQDPHANTVFSALPSFKLIDCQARHPRIVRASGQPYVTLSYLWGKGPHDKTFSWTLPQNLPRTIKDAIYVTSKLGLQYLWIDRYCINQSSKKEVKEHVASMDLIYSQSCLTIVAAAGRNPKFGLPGVGERTRVSQPHARIGKNLIVSGSPSPVDDINSSRWFKRGWTYQEGLLSPRRLIFTQKQVYFECVGMYCFETLNISPANLYTQNGHYFKSEFCHDENRNIGLFPKKLGSSLWDIKQRIREYSKRNLTDPNDILNGILGILNVFERGPLRMAHVHGVPVFPMRPKELLCLEFGDYPEKSKPEVDEWSLAKGFCHGLCWDRKRLAERRTGFPSWSWTGWHGVVEWVGHQPVHMRPKFNGDEDIQVRIQLKDGEILDIEEYVHSYDKMKMLTSNVLHIAAWVSPITLLDSTKVAEDKDVYFLIALEGKGTQSWKFSRTGTAPLLGKTCLGVHLGSGENFNLENCVYLLIVQEAEPRSSIYERVGFAEIHKSARYNSVNYTAEESESESESTAIEDSDECSDVESDVTDDTDKDGVTAFETGLPLPKLVKTWREFQLR